MTEEYVIKPYEERMKILSIRSRQTLDDVCLKLNKYGKCMIVRPTGFGKTFSLIQIARRYVDLSDKRILYVYPSKIITTEIRNNAEDKKNEFYPYDMLYGEDNKVDFITMSAICDYMGESSQSFIRNQQELLDKIHRGTYSIIMFDEMHKCASDNFKKFYHSIEDVVSADNTHIVGVTATPNRSKEEENDWLHNTMFGGIQAFEYNMANAIIDGILLLPYCPTLTYDRSAFISEYKDSLKANCKIRNERFDEDRVDLDISRYFESNGTEPEVIYNAIKHVGYSLSSNEIDESSLKFIVFFKDTQDMVERGETIENWFFDAFNKLAKKDLNLRKDFTFSVDYVISDTADKFNDNIVTEHCKKKDYRTCYLDATKIGRDEKGKLISPKSRHINLIFNVDVITVGYHVDGVAGVVLMRNTGTEITYFQQIGRAFSVKGKKQPIIFDVVRNIDKNFTTTRKRMQDILVEGAGIDMDSPAGKKVLDMLADSTITATGVEDALDSLMSKFGSTRERNVERDNDLIYYYTEMNTPLYMLAYSFDMSISEIVKLLVKNKIEIKDESVCYRNAYSAENDTIGKYFYSKIADKDYREKTGLKITVYRRVLDIISGKMGGEE